MCGILSRRAERVNTGETKKCFNFNVLSHIRAANEERQVVLKNFATICRILKNTGLCYRKYSSLSSGVLRMDIYSSGGLLLGNKNSHLENAIFSYSNHNFHLF